MGKRVQPIDTALIANWKSLDPRVEKGAWFNVNGKVYGTPYQWGPNLLMYNTENLPDAAGQLERGVRQTKPAGW
ncbi:ABC transporter [Klebsiella michiganensis]|nr:ABC transporter [Klebsiella michiganensis]